MDQIITTKQLKREKELRSKQLTILLLCCDKPEKRAALEREKANVDGLLAVIRSWGNGCEVR